VTHLINLVRLGCLWVVVRNLTRELDDRRDYLGLPQNIDEYTTALIRYDLTKTKLKCAIAEREALILAMALERCEGVKP